MMFRMKAEFGTVYINTDQIATIVQFEDTEAWEITMADGSIYACTTDVGAQLIATFASFARVPQAILALHKSDGADSPFCTECGFSWPCSTAKLGMGVQQ